MANSPFLESIRHVMRTKHYSMQTEKKLSTMDKTIHCYMAAE